MQTEFAKLDRNEDGVMTREEYEAQYTAVRQLTDNGFTAGKRTQLMQLCQQGDLHCMEKTAELERHVW